MAFRELNSDLRVTMAQIAQFASSQIAAAFSGRRSPLELSFDKELSIPEGLADLGDRKLNQILANVRYYTQHRCKHDNVLAQYDASRALGSRSDVISLGAVAASSRFVPRSRPLARIFLILSETGWAGTLPAVGVCTEVFLQ